MFWLIITTLLAAYAARLAFCFHRNRTVARKTGLPYVLFPVPVQSIAYTIAFETRFVPYVVNTWLPHGLADYINGSVYKCRWTVKDRLSKKYGSVYLLVTPAKLTCHVSDASVISQIYAARRNFPKPVESYGRSLRLSLSIAYGANGELR